MPFLPAIISETAAVCCATEIGERVELHHENEQSRPDYECVQRDPRSSSRTWWSSSHQRGWFALGSGNGLRVWLTGRPPGAQVGDDVKASRFSSLIVTAGRLYCYPRFH